MSTVTANPKEVFWPSNHFLRMSLYHEVNTLFFCLKQVIIVLLYCFVLFTSVECRNGLSGYKL